MMRTSLPAFTLLSFLLLQRSCNATPLWKKTALATLIAGSGGLAFDVIRHIEFDSSRATQTDFSSPANIPILPATPDLSGLLGQYLGSPKAAFFRLLARPLPAVTDPVAYNLPGPLPPPGAIASQDRLQRALRHRFENGDRSLDLLREYSTLCYYQGDLWDSVLALETMVKVFPDDPNARINLATLLSKSGIKAYRERAIAELDKGRRLAKDPAVFDRATENLRNELRNNP